MPVDFGTMVNLGYAIVNVSSHSDAEALRIRFDGFSSWDMPSDEVCSASWEDAEQQGLAANIERYRNSSVMHDSVPDECKPVVYVDGARAPFLPPTRRLKAPRHRVASGMRFRNN